MNLDGKYPTAMAGRFSGVFWFCRVCILRLREIFVEDFPRVFQADAAQRQYMATLAAPDTHIDVEATLSFKRTLASNEQGMLDSVLSGSCRWQLRQQGRREKLNTRKPGNLSAVWYLRGLNISGWSVLSGTRCEVNTRKGQRPRALFL